MNLTGKLPYLNPLYAPEPVSFTLSRFLNKQGIRLSNNILRQELARHPYYPSLLSISDVLNGLGISHQAYRTDINALVENFFKPLFTHLEIDGSEVFAVIECFKENKFKVVTEKAETYWYSKEELEKIWNGILLELESGESITIHEQGENYPKALKYGISVFILFTLLYFIYLKAPVFSIPQVLLLMLNIAGIIVSWILVLQHLNKNNLLVKQLCQSKTREGCGSVLSSKTSQITPWLSIAEAGLIYFTGIALSVFIFKLPVFSIYLALLAPLYSLYAIYVQAFVLKQWCRLCMVIHVIVLAGFISVVLFYRTLFLTPIWPEITQLIVFLIPAAVWLIINPILKRLMEGGHYKQEYIRIKSNPELFKALMNKEPKIQIPDELKVLQFGDTEAAHELTFISNPFCGPCAKAHTIIEEWLKGNNLNFKITIIFIHQVEESDRNRQFVEYISGITDKNKLKSVLGDWFRSDKKDLSGWAKRSQLEKTALKYNAEFLQHYLNTAEIIATPTFFINGRSLPEKYSIEDLRYLIIETD